MYLDLDLQLNERNMLFVSFFKENVYISVGGVSYVDIIYKGAIEKLN